MSVANNSGLASLTATYTDSEGEEDHDEDDPQTGTVILTEDSNLSKPSSPVQEVKVRRANVKRLVSYHDDSYISSDEEEISAEDLDNALQLNEGNKDGAQNLLIQAVSELQAKASAAAAYGIKLPEEPKGKCSNDLQEKINKFHEKMISNGLDMNKVIQQRKDFRNPSIYEKLIQYCKINELGTNYPTEYYDPLRWGKESYYEELAKVQKTEMDKREKERKEKAKVEIVTGTAKRAAVMVTSGKASNLTLPPLSDEAKRKSKWDQVAGSNSQQISLTTSVTGTKSTVISAFGSLPKRPRI